MNDLEVEYGPCKRCGKTTTLEIDPYEADVNQNIVEIFLCEGCYDIYVDDI